jgi:hypothetical protein
MRAGLLFGQGQFRSCGHARVRSASLTQTDDATLRGAKLQLLRDRSSAFG